MQMQVPYFLLSFSLIIARCIWAFPSLTLNAEPFAETGSLFFADAMRLDSFKNLFLVDAGYLTLLPRLIAVFWIRAVNAIELYPLVVSLTTLLFISFSCSFLNLNYFRKFIPSDFIRFLLSCILGFHFGYGMFLFHNISYYGAVLAVAVLALPIEKFSWKYLILLLGILSITILGKPFFLLFAPFYLAWGGHGLKKKEIKRALFYLLPTILLGIQALLIWKNRGVFIRPEQHGINLLSIYYQVLNTLSFYFYGIGNLLFGWLSGERFALLYSLIGTAGILFMAGYLWQRKDWGPLKAFAVLQILALLCFALTIKTFYPNKSWFLPNFVDDSHVFFSFIFMMIGVTILIVNSLKSHAVQVIILLIIATTSNVFGFFFPHDPFRQVENSVSQWKLYSKLLQEPTYCLPLNPQGWYTGSNCYPYEAKAQDKRISLVDSEGRGSPLRLIEVHEDFSRPTSSFGVEKFVAYDHEGKVLAETKLLTPKNYKFKFYYFPEIKEISSLEALDANGQTVIIPIEKLRFLGAGK